MRNIQFPILRNISAESLLIIGGLVVIAHAATGTADWSATVLGLAFFSLASCYTICNSLYPSIPRKRLQNLASIATVAMGLVFFASFSSQPAHAQLLVQTADSICNAFTSASDGLTAAASTTGTSAAKTTVKSIMWILRALIILVVLVSVIQMVQNRDDREKMLEIVKAPAMIVMGTIVVDVIASFVGAGATATTGCA